MLFTKQKTKLLNIAIIVAAILLLAISGNTSAATVDAKLACKPVESASKKVKDACNTYIANYNKCKATDTKCKTTAYTNYVKSVCGTGTSANTCAKDSSKVIPARVGSTGSGKLCSSLGTVTDGCICPTGQTPQYVGSTQQCVASNGSTTAQAPTTANTNPNLSKTPTIEGAPSESETYGYFENPNCKGEACLTNNPIVKWLNVIINVVAGVVGIGAVVMIIFAGVQYSTARDNAQVVQSAKEKIINVVIGLIAFGLLYTFLQWLVPGGVF